MNIYFENEHPNKDENNADSDSKKQLNMGSQPENRNTNKSKKHFFIVIAILLIGIGGFISFAYFKRLNKNATLDETCIATTNSEIYDYYKNSIVMVKHRFGIQVRIENQEPIILNEYYLENFEIFASGFFIDNSGKIITNKHVILPPDNYSDDIQTELKNIKIKLLANLPKDTDPQSYEEKIYQVLRGETITNEAPDEVQTMETDSTYDETEIEPTVVEYFANHDITIEPISMELSVMLHDTDEWLPAKIVKTAEDYNVDLGLIQLNGESTPSTVTNYIDGTKAIFDDSTIKPGTKAIMIGFPMGMNLANTNNGIIKVQMYEGDINKESDGIKFQYSIPSTQGASGAPVFNSCGQLIAVNFSGFDQQGFNFGIVAKHLFELVPTMKPDTATVVYPVTINN